MSRASTANLSRLSQEGYDEWGLVRLSAKTAPRQRWGAFVEDNLADITQICPVRDEKLE